MYNQVSNPLTRWNHSNINRYLYMGNREWNLKFLMWNNRKLLYVCYVLLFLKRTTKYARMHWRLGFILNVLMYLQTHRAYQPQPNTRPQPNPQPQPQPLASASSGNIAFLISNKEMNSSQSHVKGYRNPEISREFHSSSCADLPVFSRYFLIFLTIILS